MDLDEETAAGAKGAGDANAKRNRGQSCSLCRVKMAKNRSFALNQVSVLAFSLVVAVLTPLSPSVPRRT